MALPEGSGDLTRQEIGQLLLRGYTSDEEEGAEAKEPGTSMDGMLVSLFYEPPCWPSGKASASRAKDPGLESCLRQIFSGLSHTSD